MLPANQRLQTTLTSAALLRICNCSGYGIRNTEYGSIRAMHSRLFLAISPAQTSYFHFSCGLILRLCLPSCTGTLAWHGLNWTTLVMPSQPRHVPVGTKFHQPGTAVFAYHEVRVPLSVFHQGLRITCPMRLHVAPRRSMEGLSSMLPLREQPQRNSIVRYLPVVVFAC